MKPTLFKIATSIMLLGLAALALGIIWGIWSDDWKPMLTAFVPIGFGGLAMVLLGDE